MSLWNFSSIKNVLNVRHNVESQRSQIPLLILSMRILRSRNGIAHTDNDRPRDGKLYLSPLSSSSVLTRPPQCVRIRPRPRALHKWAVFVLQNNISYRWPFKNWFCHRPDWNFQKLPHSISLGLLKEYNLKVNYFVCTIKKNMNRCDDLHPGLLLV